MNRPNKILSLMLTLVVALGLVILTGHSYSHENSELTSCHLCIEHGNSGHAIISSDSTLEVVPADITIEPGQQIVSAVISAHYRLPVRAPPLHIS